MKTALLFPGQGAQKVGMGKALAESFAVAKQTFAEADDALGFSLSTLCWDGPTDALTLTAHTQPAILMHSIAALRVLRETQGVGCDIAAGHSLGEWSALVAVGALPFADAVRLVHLRGQLMQDAVPAGVGAMAAIMGLAASEVGAVCAEAAAGDVCAPANFNGGGQIVIAGHRAAVERAVAGAKAKGGKAIPLKVSAPFHCALMAPVAEGLGPALGKVAMSAMTAPVISNVEATLYADSSRTAALLLRQITAPVRWEESMRTLASSGVTTVWELGPGSVLKGLLKRIDETVTVKCFGEPADLST